jgi:hypothetical protein
LLKPTKLNLYGLDIRFRYTEELLRKEKESKNISNKYKFRKAFNKHSKEARFKGIIRRAGRLISLRPS